MNGAIATYDPRLVDLYLAGTPADAFADGSFIDIEYAADVNKVVVGAKGDQTITKINNPSGMCKIRLKQNSQMHTILTLYTLADNAIAGGAPQLPLIMMQGSTLLAEAVYKVGKAAARTFPDGSSGNDEPICEWTLVLANLRITS